LRTFEEEANTFYI